MEYNCFIMLLIRKIFTFFILALMFVSCNKTSPRVSKFLCSTEYFTNRIVYADSNKNIHFRGAKQITDSIAHSGKYCLLLNNKNHFAFLTKIRFRFEGSYKLSFWRKGGGDSVFVIVQSDTSFYAKSCQIVDSTKSGWEKISLSFNISLKNINKVFRLYVWNKGGFNTFVDDFSLKPVFVKNLQIADSLFSMYIDEKYMQVLQKEREKAFKNGVLTTDSQSWIKAIVLWANKTFKTKVRLKGDWLDHIEGQKWSFRIKIKNNKAFKGMKVFSVQNPNTRYFLAQWFLYTLFRSQDILAPRYGFVYAQRNERFLGIYAYEEHFEKQLLESLKRREGPILKLSEDSFWDLIIEYNKTKHWYNYPFYEAGKILPFFQNKTLKNKTLNSEFEIAKNLVYQHKYGLAKASDIFDIDNAAKFFALVNIMQGYHGFRWHNQRYYYNPITSKLEFVDYDNYVGGGIFKLTDRIIFGDFTENDIPKKTESVLNYYFFSDSVFVGDYIKYLKKYSAKSFWDSVFTHYNDKLSYFQKILSKEYKNYHFDKKMFYSQADSVRKYLPAYIEKVNKGLYKHIELTYTKKIFYHDSAVASLFKDYVKSFTEKKSNNKLEIKIINYFPTDIELVAYVYKNNRFPLDPINIGAYSGRNNEVKTTIFAPKIDYLIFSAGKKEVKIRLLPWSEPKAYSPRQELEQANKFPKETFYHLEANNVIFSGKQRIEKIILIPKNYNVIFEAGTEIDFAHGGGFLCYSSVFMRGTKENPIRIYSSDKSALGFTILNAPKVEMNNVVFDGLNTFNYKGWTLTGAVTIYESNVAIHNCKFINNVCEDDLNTVRCSFVVSNTLFANTFSDAFDSDFSRGIVDKCVFNNLGDDAIDFSTSNVLIKNCSMNNIFDKGISGGEASHLTVENCTISEAKIAVASKDRTVLYLSDLYLKNSVYGLVAFQKKAEYAEAQIFAKNIHVKGIVKFSLIEKGSLLVLNGIKIKGKYKNIAKKFY